MDVENSQNAIRITHYINPHMFWYVRLSDLPSMELMQLELDINKHLKVQEKTQNSKNYKPKTGEIAVVYDFNKCNYIRVQVDRILELNQEVKCCLWAIDYGVIYNSDVKWIRKLPTEFQTTDLGLIKFAGLQGVAPAELKYDYEEQENKMEIGENWSTRAVDVVKNIIDDAEEITFKVELVTPNNQEFGNATVATNKKINVNLIESLIKSQTAIKTPNFMNILSELKTNCISRYEDNDRRVILNFHENRYTGVRNAARQLPDSVSEAADAPERHLEVGCDTEQVLEKVSNWNKRNEEWHKRQKEPNTDNARPGLVPAHVLDEPPQLGNNPFAHMTMCQQIMALRANVPRKPKGSVDGVRNMMKEAREKASLDSSSDGQGQSASERLLQLRQNKKTAAAKSMPKLPAKTKINFLPAGADVNATQRKKPVRPVHVAESSSSNGAADDPRDRRPGHGEKPKIKLPSNNFSKALTEERW